MTIVQKIKARPITTAVVVVIVLAGGWWWYRQRQSAQGTVQYLLGSVSKQSVIVAVNGSGQVTSLNQIDLKPQNSGVITGVNVVVGQQVKANQVLVVLDQKDAASTLQQARASVEAAQANYQKVLAGTPSTDMAVAEAAVTAAQSAVDDAQKNLAATQAQQQAAVANAYRTLLNSAPAAQPTATNVSGVTPTISGLYEGPEGSYAISLYASSGDLFYSYNGLESGQGKIVANLPLPLGSHGLNITFSTTNINSNDSWTVTLPNTTASMYLTNYNAYQAALAAQQTALVTAQNQVTTAESNLQQAQVALNQKQVPPTQADVLAARAQVDSAVAELHSAETQYVHNEVLAPFDGEVAVVNVQKGDTAGPTTAAVTLVTHQKIAEVTLNETDAAKVQSGQPVTLTFDSLPDLTIVGKVAQIDVLGTVTQGVVNYNVQVAFATQDSRLKPGMSANASIVTDAKMNTLAVPSAAVKTVGGQTYVDLVTPDLIATKDATTGLVTLKGTPVRQPVQVGIASDSLTEIVGGLQEGDQIVVQRIDSSKTNSSAASGGFRLPGLGGGGGTFRGGGGALR